MKCIFKDENGICHGRYKGFKCIGERCEDYGKNKKCPYYREWIEEEELILFK